MDGHQEEEKIIKNLLLYGLRVYKMDVPLDCDLGDLTKKECMNIKQKAKLEDDFKKLNINLNKNLKLIMNDINLLRLKIIK